VFQPQLGGDGARHRASHQAEYICRISRDNAVREKGGSFEEVGVEELIIMREKAELR
jgi:hypothetical protein